MNSDVIADSQLEIPEFSTEWTNHNHEHNYQFTNSLLRPLSIIRTHCMLINYENHAQAVFLTGWERYGRTSLFQDKSGISRLNIACCSTFQVVFWFDHLGMSLE